MDWPALGRSLADLGSFALLVLLVVGPIGFGLWKQWWVPGWLYRDERARRVAAEADVARLTKAAANRGARDDRRRHPVADGGDDDS